MADEHEVYICPKGSSVKVNPYDQTQLLNNNDCEQFQSFESPTKWKWGYNIPVFGKTTTGYDPTSRTGEINKDATFYKITQQASGRYGDPITCTSFITNFKRNAKFKLGTDENLICQIKNHN